MTNMPTVARPQALVVPGAVVTAMIMFAGAVAFLAMAVTIADQPTRAVVWGSFALASYAAGMLCLVGALPHKGLGFSRWRFAPWILLWYIVAFGLATTTWSQPQTSLSDQIAVPSVLRALWLIAIGMTAWTAGYFVGPGRPLRTLAISGIGLLSRRFAARVRSPIAPWILYAIGAAAQIASAATSGRFGYVGDVASTVTIAPSYGQILNLLALCEPLAVAAAAMQVFQERMSSARITLSCLFLAELAVGLASGVKENVIITVLAVVIPFSAARRRLPRTALVLAVLIFLLIVIPFTAAYRNDARGGGTTLTSSQALNMAPGILAQSASGQNLRSVLLSSGGYLLERIREIDSSSIILQRTPGQIGYLSPVQLIEASGAGLVPRAVWPSKPVLMTGYQISQEYYGLPPTVYTSTAISQSADLYRYGGWPPVIIGMFLLGCGVRLLDDVLDVRANPHAIFLVLLLLPTLAKNEVGWTPILAGLPSTAFIWLLAVALTFRRRRPA